MFEMRTHSEDEPPEYCYVCNYYMKAIETGNIYGDCEKCQKSIYAASAEK